jgi:hypothetical protein
VSKLPSLSGQTKIVLGNGADIHCGLNTRYSDFFATRKDCYRAIEEWIISSPNPLTYVQESASNWEDFRPRPSLPQDLTLWELLFYLISSNHGGSLKIPDLDRINWCDIESVMRSSLTGDSLPLFGRVINYPVQWTNIIKLFTDKTFLNKNKPDNPNEVVLAMYIKEFWSPKDVQEIKQSFYSNLLDDLQKFETMFGEFVAKQITSLYSENLQSLIQKELSNGFNTVASIDSFNYSNPGLLETNAPIRHLNGDSKAPIFGIDSLGISTNSPEYIFTKTWRHLERDAQNAERQISNPFQNVVIYGHSLNAQDFSYFFPIFDSMNLRDPTQHGVLAIGYTVFDSSRTQSIRRSLIKSVAYLFEKYEDYIRGGEIKDHHLLDSLVTFNRLLIFQVPEIEHHGFPKFGYPKY